MCAPRWSIILNYFSYEDSDGLRSYCIGSLSRRNHPLFPGMV